MSALRERLKNASRRGIDTYVTHGSKGTDRAVETTAEDRVIGFVVNPIAGMGGRVGLKGTDGKVEAARSLGAEPRARDRGERALRALADTSVPVTLLTAGAPMGADVARAAGFDPTVVTEPSTPTGAADTADAVAAFCEAGVDLVLFVGGDGTAQDVAAAIEGASSEPPILGVPAGVKVFSSVFATTPENAGRLAARFDAVEGREVMDIDEDAYREGEVQATLKAVVDVPVGPELQGGKQLAGGDLEGLAAGFAEEVDPDTTYVLGAGSTLGAIKRALGFEGSPLGVDVWRDGTVLARDANEAHLLETVESPAEAVVSPIGGQGFILGRGTPQLSPAVLDRCDLTVVASKRKLDALEVLRVDTDDRATNERLTGWQRVRVGRFEHRMMKVV